VRGDDDHSRRARRRLLAADGLEVGLRLGPHPLGWALGLAASTVHAILKRNGCSRLAPRRPRGEVTRYERERPGELLHVDVKKLGTGTSVSAPPRSFPRSTPTIATADTVPWAD
jgi:hypothetical protein